LSDNAMATADDSFDYSFTGLTTITWDVSVSFGGPYGNVLLDLGGLTEGYQGALITNWQGTITQTLGPGTYTFSADASVSDGGSASFSLTNPIIPVPSAPEPGTMALVAGALVWFLWVAGGRRLRYALTSHSPKVARKIIEK
jgi:hypothetical protein